MTAGNPAANEPKAPRSRPALDTLTVGAVASRNRPLQIKAVGLVAVMMAAGLVSVALNTPDMGWAYVLIALTSLVPLVVWTRQPRKGLPMLPLFVLQQAAVFLMPIYMGNKSLSAYSPQVILTAAFSVGVFFLLLPLGWIWGRRQTTSRPSLWDFDPFGAVGRGDILIRFALMFLAINISFEFLSKLGFMGWITAGVRPILTAILLLLSAFGAFLGAFVVTFRGKDKGGAGPYWVAFYVLFFLTSSGLLLSGVTLIVVSTAMGMALGSGRVPWVFVLLMGGILGFLNLGKFDMRERYGGEYVSYGGESVSNTGLAALPAFYAEWSQCSIDNLLTRTATGEDSLVPLQKKGQSLLERMDNFQNMVFVVNAQQVMNIEGLHGATYTMIPQLLIPRVFWPGKPRTHEGQVRLNLHYGRQGSVLDTMTTYVAWGFLPEAVGNFGAIGGALFLGLVLGFLMGMLESWSARKRLFSLEGLLVIGLLLQLLISFEMVASVFVTSTFQMLVVLFVGGVTMAMLLDQGKGARAKG